jgi:serine/threonine-protein kinase SRPK3
MREPPWMLQRCMADGVYSFGLLGYTVKFLLTGLAYLHNECDIIHTGSPVPVVPLLSLYPPQIQNPRMYSSALRRLCRLTPSRVTTISRKFLSDRIIYLSQNDFGHFNSTPGQPKITDFEWTLYGTSSQWYISLPCFHIFYFPLSLNLMCKALGSFGMKGSLRWRRLQT